MYSYKNVAKRSGNDFFARFVSKNDTKRRTHPVLCSVDVPLTYHHSIQRDTVRIAATVAVHFEFGSSFFQDCDYYSILLGICQGFFTIFIKIRKPPSEIALRLAVLGKCYCVLLSCFGANAKYTAYPPVITVSKMQESICCPSVNALLAKTLMALKSPCAPMQTIMLLLR